LEQNNTKIVNLSWILSL